MPSEGGSDTRRILFICVIAILALGTVGVSSAAWSVSDMQVHGTVAMGVVDGHLTDPRVSDDIPPPNRKVIAEVSPDGHLLTITLPHWNRHYSAEVEFGVQNVGTIPLAIESINVNAPDRISVRSFGEGTIVAAGDSEWGLGVLINVPKKADLPATVTVTLDCREWAR